MTIAENTTPMADGVASDRYVATSPYGLLGSIGWTLLALLAGIAALVFAVAIALAVGHGDLVTRGLAGLRSLPPINQMVIGLYGMLALQAAVVLVALLAASRRGYRVADVLALRAPRSGWVYIWGPLLAIAVSIVVGYILSHLMPFEPLQDMELWLPVLNSEHWWLVFIIAVIGAPLSEEVWFRGFLLPSFARTFAGKGPGNTEGRPQVTGFAVIGAAALATALLFAVAHAYQIQGAITVLVLALVLSFIVWWSGSLWPAIVAHGVYNFYAFAMIKWALPYFEATATGLAT